MACNKPGAMRTTLLRHENLVVGLLLLGRQLEKTTGHHEEGDTNGWRSRLILQYRGEPLLKLTQNKVYEAQKERRSCTLVCLDKRTLSFKPFNPSFNFTAGTM